MAPTAATRFLVISLSLSIFSTRLTTGFYVQPEVLFLSEHPENQQVVLGSTLSLSCGVRLRGLSEEEGGLTVPTVGWSFNNTSSISDVFPEAQETQELADESYLRSTLVIPEATLAHSGTYHCSVGDGTDEGNLFMLPGLCFNLPCYEFTTASYPATITVLGNSTVVEVVEVQMCSSVILRCGSRLPAQGLRPVLEWTRDGITLNSSSHVHDTLPNGDVVLYGADVDNYSSLEGVYECIASSDTHSMTVVSYTVYEGGAGNGSGTNPDLILSPESPAEGDSLSLHLSLSSFCPRNGSTLACVWTRNGVNICSSEINTNTQCVCGERVLVVRSVTRGRDSGRYCCVLESMDAQSVCIDIKIEPQTPPLLSSPHNGTTFTTAHQSPLTLTCFPSLTSSHYYWLYNGAPRPEWNGATEISVNTSFVGVYQCFSGNKFGYAVATLRILPHGLTNPPGIPRYHHEVPHPDSAHRPAYFFSWQPPTYPAHLDPNKHRYSLSTRPQPTLSWSTSTVAFIGRNTYASLVTFVEDSGTGEQLSEWSPAFWKKYNESRCEKLVYFPPTLEVNCGYGTALLSWANNPDNLIVYPSIFYNLNGDTPGLYYINITCYLQNNTLLEIGYVYEDIGSTVFKELEGLAVGTECVFSGAATPPYKELWPQFCLDPTHILYNSTSCVTTGYVEFENTSYFVSEAEGVKDICMTVTGSTFSFQLVTTYKDSTTEEREVDVSSAGGDGSVCVSVNLRDDQDVNEDRNISLSLKTEDTRVSTGPSATLAVFNDDVVRVGFAKTQYEVLAGDEVGVCVLALAEGELEKTVSVNLSLSSEPPGRVVVVEEVAELDREMLVFSATIRTICARLQTNSSLPTNTALTLSLLHSPDRDIRTFNSTSHITIIAAEPDTQKSLPTVVIVVSVSVTLLVVAITVILLCSLLRLYRYLRNTAGSFKFNINFPDEPFGYQDYEPHLMEFGSVPTLFESLGGRGGGVVCEEETGEGCEGVTSVSGSRDRLGTLVEEREEGEVCEGVRENATPPEVRTTRSSLASGKSENNSSHDEYIASDSILLLSYPPTVTDGSSSSMRHTRDTSLQEVDRNRGDGIRNHGDGICNRGDTIGVRTASSGTWNGNAGHGRTGSGSLGIGSAGETVSESEGMGMESCGMELLSDAELAVFLGDSGIDVDGHNT